MKKLKDGEELNARSEQTQIQTRFLLVNKLGEKNNLPETERHTLE